MKKFLISPSIGGFSLTDKAAHYLDWKMLISEVNKGNVQANGKGVPDLTDFESFEKHIRLTLGYYVWDCYKGDTPYMCIATSFKNKCEKIERNELIPLVELLEYQYEELDKLNDGCELRLVEGPDDAPVYIDCDDENLSEYLATKTPYYPHPFDEYDRFKYVVNKFFAEVWNHEPGDFEFKEVQFAVNEKYAMARYKDSFVLLQKVQFYNKKPTFEIIDFKGQDQSVFAPRITTSIVYKDQLEEFINLYMNLIDDK